MKKIRHFLTVNKKARVLKFLKKMPKVITAVCFFCNSNLTHDTYETSDVAAHLRGMRPTPSRQKDTLMLRENSNIKTNI